MKFLWAGGVLVLLGIGGLFFAAHSFGQTQGAPAPDFATAVQMGLQSLAVNSDAKYAQQQIQNQDYKSTWDEFGMNTLVDGTTPPAEANDRITEDIVRDVQTAQNYDEQEADYLQSAQVTPEQIQAVEDSVGSDIPPDATVDPNPSVDSNPDISISAVDASPEDNADSSASSLDAGNTSAPTSTNEAIVETSTPETSTSSLDVASTTDISASSSEGAIYDAILQGEQAQPIDQPPPPPPDTTVSPIP